VGLTLLSKGHQVTCWYRTRANGDELLRAGATWRESPRAAAEGADFVVIFVWNEEALRAVLAGPDGLYAAAKAGQVHVETSTQLPATAVSEARELAVPGDGRAAGEAAGMNVPACPPSVWIAVRG
jgi:3-hydroxyisobutyrate dehydrogenase-like beta-hydroxyacid dehydrogenase